MISRPRLHVLDSGLVPAWAELSDERRGHTERVAALVSGWADGLGVDHKERIRWLKAVGLHDVLKDAPASRLLELAPVCWDLPALWHGPAAANLAARMGEEDIGILDAVRYHSVGFAHWEIVGKVLFMADYLEPGRDYHRPRHVALASQVPTKFTRVLRAVTAERLAFVVAHQYPIVSETAEFWNTLICDP